MDKDKNNTFIFSIGAQKSGTTTLHNLLSSHNQISLPRIKETHFFSHDEIFLKGFNWYLKQFNLDNKIICEVDPSYLFFGNSAIRIKLAIQDPKFIVIFRKPLDRALSHYLMSFYRGFEDLSFFDALESEANRLEQDKNLFSFIHHSYLERGNYVKQLEVYLNNFNKSNFLFIKFENLISNENSRIIDSICNFINIENNFDTKKMPESNKKRKIRSTMVRDLLYKDTFFKKAISTLIPSDEIKLKLKNVIDLFNSKDYSKSESKQQIEESLRRLPQKYFIWNNEQAQLLSSVTGLDLSDWEYN